MAGSPLNTTATMSPGLNGSSDEEAPLLGQRKPAARSAALTSSDRRDRSSHSLGGELRAGLAEHYQRNDYLRCESMGALVRENLESIRLTGVMLWRFRRGGGSRRLVLRSAGRGAA